MTANSNMGFQYQGSFPPPSAFNRHAISFQSGAINSSTGMIPAVNSGVYSNSVCYTNSGGYSPGGFSVTSGGVGVVNSGGGACFLDPVPGLRQDTGLAADWSHREQAILEEGLAKYADETNILMYIKIAATLPEKTVRDVALRCRWMTKKENGKRRKPEEHCIGKKMKERKEKLGETSSKVNIPPIPQTSMVTHPFMVPHMDPNDLISCEAPAIGSTTRHLLEENAQAFSQISANLATFQPLQVEDNIDLLLRTRNNLTTILNDMNNMPGIMSQMPPLPVKINEELVNTLLPDAVQGMGYNSHGIHMKQEPK